MGQAWHAAAAAAAGGSAGSGAAAAASLLPWEAAEVEHVRRALYGSHFLSTWGQRGWEFSIGLIMLELQPTSLLLVSVFGLVDAGV